MITSHVQFVHHFEGPQTFYLSDVAKAADTDEVKLEWLYMELGVGRDLIAFAEKFMNLFSSVITSTVKQKFTCLKLYRTYAGIDGATDKGDYSTIEDCRARLYTMECQIPPHELQQFQSIWNTRAPRRCKECNCEVPEDHGTRCKKCMKHPTDAPRSSAKHWTKTTRCVEGN